MTTVDDLLDDRMTGGGDYPDPWKPEEEGETVQGVVTARRDNPWAPNDEEDPKQMLHIATDDEEIATSVHSVLSGLIKDEDVREGDFVRIEYTGEFTTDRGQQAKDYRLGVVREEELEDSDIEVPETDGGVLVHKPSDTSEEFDVADATVGEVEDYVADEDDISELESLLEAEKAGKDRKTAKETIQSRLDTLQSADNGEAVEFLESLLEFHGTLDVEEADRFLNDVRELDVSVEGVVEATEYEIENGTVQ